MAKNDTMSFNEVQMFVSGENVHKELDAATDNENVEEFVLSHHLPSSSLSPLLCLFPKSTNLAAVSPSPPCLKLFVMVSHIKCHRCSFVAMVTPLSSRRN